MDGSKMSRPKSEPKGTTSPVTLARECGGLTEVIWRAIGAVHEVYIRPYLPTSKGGSTARLNSLIVPYEEPKWFDRYLGIPNYEWKLVCGMKRVVRPGDDVFIVGGGYGVSSVYAGRFVGPEGSITVFEGASTMVDSIRQASSMNGIRNVSVTHGIVGPANALRGDANGAADVDPGELPAHDVLILDCEGAEREIIPNLTSQPRAIVVETHGLHDAPPDLIRDAIESSGYDIILDVPMDSTNGIRVVVGLLADEVYKH